tara:strand:+ start:281 stop:589 length:309 start_codon:yes stop_codon:yes gene_type:complete
MKRLWFILFPLLTVYSCETGYTLEENMGLLILLGGIAIFFAIIYLPGKITQILWICFCVFLFFDSQNVSLIGRIFGIILLAGPVIWNLFSKVKSHGFYDIDE